MVVSLSLLSLCLGQAAWTAPPNFSGTGLVPGSVLSTGRSGTTRDTLVVAEASIVCAGPGCSFAVATSTGVVSETTSTGPIAFWDVLPANAQVQATATSADVKNLRMMLLPLPGMSAYVADRNLVVPAVSSTFAPLLSLTATGSATDFFIFYGVSVRNPVGGQPFRVLSRDSASGNYTPFNRPTGDSSVIVLPGRDAHIFGSWSVSRPTPFAVELSGHSTSASLGPILGERRLFAVPVASMPLVANENCPSGVTDGGRGLGCSVAANVTPGTTYAVVGGAVLGLGPAGASVTWDFELLSEDSVIATQRDSAERGEQRHVRALGFVTPTTMTTSFGVRLSTVDAGTTELEGWEIGYSVIPLGVFDGGADAGSGGTTDGGADAGSGGGTDAGSDAGSGGTTDGGADAGPDGGADAGSGGTTDGGADAGSDGGATPFDAGASVPDAGLGDAGLNADAGSLTMDAGSDAGSAPIDSGVADGGLSEPARFTIGCSSSGPSPVLLGWFALVALRRRRVDQPPPPGRRAARKH